MKRLWITYAWVDNADNDIDYLIAELEKKEIEARIDRQVIIAGRRLWDQIAANISSPEKSDAWAIYATEASLRSEACQEELAIALDRALRTRGTQFPLIGIFPEQIDPDLIPPAIRTRLYVMLSDGDCIERIRSGVYDETPDIPIQGGLNIVVSRHIYQSPQGPKDCIEVRPRIGRWMPAIVAVPVNEKNRISCVIIGARGAVTGTGVSYHAEDSSKDGKYHVHTLKQPVDYQNTLHIILNSTPSVLAVGENARELIDVMKIIST